jgi:diguanylate cyclase (GGDEF)-like protein
LKRTERQTIRILSLEDSELDEELIIRALRHGGLSFVSQRVETGADFAQAIKEFHPDLILLDCKLPTIDGTQALEMAVNLCPEVPVIIVTGTVGEDMLIELMRTGATDFVLKDRISERLVPAVNRAIQEIENLRARHLAEEQGTQLNKELRQLATHDPLTGAANRTLMMEILKKAVQETDPLNPSRVFFYIDLNRFKNINDNYGHQLGDQLLVQVTRRLDSIRRANDHLGNFGGDKFFLLMEEGNLKENLQLLINQIKGCFYQPFSVKGYNIPVTASIGGVLLNAPGITPSDLLLQAEEAMRLVKSGVHKGFCMADEVIIREMKHRNEIDQKMAKAIESNRLFLAFQPIVELESGKVIGAEALLRCRDTDGTIMSAADFIPSLERSNQLSPVDEWVFSELIHLYSGIAKPLLEIPGYRFSFNVTSSLLTTADYAEKILLKIKTAGISPNSVILETLEGSFLPNNETVQKNLALLRSEGVRIAVDDFGTGYSNMQYLFNMPIDIVKIDKTFISGGNGKRHAILSAMVSIAKHLGYEVIGEGVEMESEAEALKALGCKYAQGYLYGKAMPPEDLAAFIRDHG